MTPTFFKNQAEFRAWLAENYQKEKEILVGFYKTGSGKLNMTWSQSVDEALCFGWIDGIRRSIDKDSYCIRFTPRKANSIWSVVNIQKVEALTKSGLMQPAGLEAFSRRVAEKSGIYSFEEGAKSLEDHLEQQFKANEAAWQFFTTQAPSYQKNIVHWIMAAKQEATKLARLDKTIAASEQKKRL
ncbi:MAG: YdeI/OmpD-associated family protein [Saprospiraceae bacterium]|nr:YdeI/OmpD-associated family protein [Saprospiraceae bacterium]